MTGGDHRGSAQRRMGPLRALAHWPALLLALLVVALATGCYNKNTGETNIEGLVNITLPAFPQQGAHAVVVFSEMHYSPALRSQEGPRLLPPADSVPVTGREVSYASLEEYSALSMPHDYAAKYESSAAKELYRVNCLVCHGSSMTGDGTMRQHMNRGPLPADLMSEISTDSPAGELFAFITEGGRQGYATVLTGRDSTSPMPPFKYLLTEEERWMLVAYLMEMQGR